MSAIITKLISIILEESNHLLSHKTLTALNEDLKKVSKVQAIADLLRELSDAADADGVAWNSFTTGIDTEPAPVAAPITEPEQAELAVESANGSKKRIAEHLKKFEAAVESGAPADPVATPVSADGYIMLGNDDIIQKGDEWRLRSGLKHSDVSRRRWRKAHDIGYKVGDFTKSEYRRKA